MIYERNNNDPIYSTVPGRLGSVTEVSDLPLTCSRCGKSSGPARIDRYHDTTNEIAAWAEKHRGGECRP